MLSIFTEFGLHCAGCGWCDQTLDITGNRTFNDVMREAYDKGWENAHRSEYDHTTLALCPECASSDLYRKYRFKFLV